MILISNQPNYYLSDSTRYLSLNRLHYNSWLYTIKIHPTPMPINPFTWKCSYGVETRSISFHRNRSSTNYNSK